jgi:hypothetical protein
MQYSSGGMAHNYLQAIFNHLQTPFCGLEMPFYHLQLFHARLLKK